MIRNPTGGTLPSSPDGTRLHPQAEVSLSDALDTCEEHLLDEEDLIEPVEIGGIDAALGLAAIAVGSLLALGVGVVVAVVAVIV
jgi:hypothetical protein